MKVGNNTIIHDTVIFRHTDNIEIGDNCIIDPYCYFSSSVKIGNNVHIGPGVYVIGGKNSKLIMEDFSGISLGCRLICGSDDFVQDITGPTIPSQFRPNAIIGNIILRKHSLLGCNCIVHPNVELPLGVAIGSGALIRKKLKYDTEWTIYYYSDNTLQYLGDRNKDKIIQSEIEYLAWKYHTDSPKLD